MKRHSAALYQRAMAVSPGGVNSPVRAWKSVGGQPLFVTHGLGSHVWDEDANRYIDYVCSWGALPLGHCNDHVIARVLRTVQNGSGFGAPTRLEVELAETIQGALPSVEMLRFVNSGTEATMSALRLARAVTGRAKILKFEGGYHGHADSLLIAAGSGSATFGVPSSPGVTEACAGDTITVHYNDLQSVEEVFSRHGSALAAVIVEPIAGNMGVIAPAAGFLQGLRNMCDRFGALLIFDEVITGFRASWGGAQALYNVLPDITCLGKVIGGGFPVGAYGGTSDIMRNLSPVGEVYQAGTLSGNPVAMASGLATLEVLAQEGTYQTWLQKTEVLANGLRAIFAEAGIDSVVNSVNGVLTIFFSKDEVTDMRSASGADMAKFGRFFHGMIEQGVYLPPSGYEGWFISLAHLDEDLQFTLEAAQAVANSGVLEPH